MIIREAERSMDFYWNRDKQLPFAGARLALILKPWGGLPTSYPVDPVPKPARDCAGFTVLGKRSCPFQRIATSRR